MSKKFTSYLGGVLMAALLLAVPAQAQVAKRQAPAKKLEAHKIVSVKKTAAMEKAIDAYKSTKAVKEEALQTPLRPQEGRNHLRPYSYVIPQAPLTILKATGEEVDANGIITKPGEGVRKVYSRAGGAFKYTNSTGVIPVDQEGEVDVVECEDGTVYIKNIVSNFIANNWVKGTKSGNTITIPVGQVQHYNASYRVAYTLWWGLTSGEGDNEFTKDTSKENITFTVDGNTISLVGSDVDHPIGMFYDYSGSTYFDGEADYNTVFTYAHEYVPIEKVTITLPEGVATETWYTQGSTYANSGSSKFKSTVTYAKDGSDIYLQGLFTLFPEAWIKGTIDGTTVTFKGLQYLGSQSGAEVYAIGTDGAKLEDFVMSYDAETGTLTNVNELLANGSDEKIYYYSWIEALTITKDAPAEEVAETGAPVDEIPYENKFETAEDFAQFGVLDSNEDGSTWTLEKDNVSGSDGSARYRYNGDNDGNDWLVSPAIKLTAGVKYRVAFDARAQSDYYAERVELKVGKEAKASALTEQVIAATEVTWNTYETLENEEFTVAEDGYYYFGIHAISDADKYYLWVDNFVVELGLKPGAPAAPEVEVLAGSEGDQTATVKVTAPTQNAGGEDLTENISKIEILRNGEVVGEFTDVAPGAMKRFFDEPATAGVYTYQAVPYNSVGKGAKSEKVSAFIGIDVPADLGDVDVVDNATSLTFSWEPVGNVGPNGGYVNPSEVAYGIYTTELVSFWGFQWWELAEKIGEATGVGTATIDYSTEEGDQQDMQFAVQPSNEAGTGIEGYTTSLLIGKSYELPFNESFAGKSLHYYWSSNAFLGVSDEATDDDGVALVLAAQDVSNPIQLISGKLNISKAINPVLVFDVKSANVSQLYVFGAKDGGDFDVLQTVTLKSDNQTVKVPLTSLKDGRYAQIAFLAQYTTPLTADDEGNIIDWGDNIVMDAIRVVDLYEYNLGVTVTAPATVTAGQTATVKAIVENKGENAANSYTVTIKAGNEELLSETVTEALAPFKKAEYTAEFATTIFDQVDDVTFTAEVAFDNELEPDDNTAETIITIKEPTVAAPENLTAKDKGDAGVDLAWTAPSNSTEEVTDDVESYDDNDNGGIYDADAKQYVSNTGTIGEWTVYDGSNGELGYGFSGIETALGQPASWIVFNPLAANAELTAYTAHSGDKYFISACKGASSGDVPATDNWLISPELPGVAQTVKFYTRELVTDYGPESYEILVSSTNKEIESFTKIADATCAVTEWEEVSFDLPEGTKYFAIRHVSKDIWALLVDDVTFLQSGGIVASYNIYYEGDLIATVEGDKTTYTVAGNKLSAGKRRTFDVTAVYTNGVESKPATVNINVTTAIEEIVKEGKPVDVYALDGRLVRKQTKDFSGLKGVYVINGKAILVK
ncbi:MAG: choice-of-anchor J domain-containing protein [Prevotella sp.]|nr:choice-of-anchor J domain-containing protein [Prevotella sp.]